MSRALRQTFVCSVLFSIERKVFKELEIPKKGRSNQFAGDASDTSEPSE